MGESKEESNRRKTEQNRCMLSCKKIAGKIAVLLGYGLAGDLEANTAMQSTPEMTEKRQYS